MTGTGLDGTIGTLLSGRFRVDELLGRGGMATVYLAEDESLGRTVAVKVFRADLADGEDLRRQNEEIQLLATLNHPSLVTLFDADTDPVTGCAYLVMELVTGEDLRTRLTRGPLSPSEVAIIGQNLADALAYVHARGIVHRDLKPGNILLPEHDIDDAGSRAKLADFGIARIVDGTRLTATGAVLGTASYFSPEQALGEAISPASDLYSLGLVLLECLTGERAFPGSAVESMTQRLARDPDVPGTIDDSWVGLLRGMTNRNPDARPTARDVAGALARLASASDPTLPDSTLPDPTLRLPVAEQTVAHTVGTQTEELERTQAFAKLRAPKQRTPKQSTGNGERRPRWHKLMLGIGVLAVIVLLGWLATFTISLGAQPDETPPAPTYPAVEGPLGTHLDQLQRSVEP